jgi:hypothetical protein
MEFKKIDSLRDIRLNPRIGGAIALLAISLISAIAINASANRSVLVWATSNQLGIGNEIKANDLKQVRVFLPENSKLYFSTKAKLIGLTTIRPLGTGELIPVAAVTSEKNVKTKKSVPIKVLRNDYPSDLTSGSIIDIYSLPSRDLASKGSSQLIAHGVLIQSIDLRNKDIGGEIGIVLKMNDESIENFLTQTINSRLVVVQSAF